MTTNTVLSSHRLFYRTPCFYGMVALFLLFNSAVVLAQPCYPATMFGTNNGSYMGVPYHDAQASSVTTMAGSGPFGAFIGGGCMTMTFGGATSCGAIITPAGNALFALFPSTAANTSNAGCTFTCPGGTCKVKGGAAGGMPVELMEFKIED